MWLFAAHLLQGSTCCLFRDGLLHISGVLSGYLRNCWLSVIANQSGHSSLTAGINKDFLPREKSQLIFAHVLVQGFLVVCAVETITLDLKCQKVAFLFT